MSMHQKGFFNTQEILGQKTFWKLTWRSSQKKQATTKSSRSVGKHEANKKVFV
jgi:hypothetical protein